MVERGGRKGVVDREGEMIVPAEYHAVVVTPMAFLVATFPRRWGALDRRGDELLLPAGRRAADVLDELDRLIIDNRPIL